MHQPADLLVVHTDPGMKEPHVDPHNAFGITPKVVGIKDQSEVKFVLSLKVSLISWNCLAARNGPVSSAIGFFLKS